MKTGIIGDMHMKEFLAYADYISDKRVAEKKAVMEFAVEAFKACDNVVFMGDNFNSKNNSSETNREFVEFLERFADKEVYIMSGNHEKKGDGKTAIDFLREVNKPNWHIYTEFGTDNGMDFLPNMLNSELGVETYEEATKAIMDKLRGGDILFAHHMVTGTTYNGIKTDDATEVVLPKEELEKRYKLIVAGHIHAPQQYGKVWITGNLFTTFVGELEKYIYIVDEMFQVKKLTVPCRPIYKLENPTAQTIANTPANSIVKAIVTDKDIDIEQLETDLDKFDAHLLLQDYPNERKQIKIEDGAMDFSIEAMLKLYSEVKDVDLAKLMTGYELVNA